MIFIYTIILIVSFEINHISTVATVTASRSDVTSLLHVTEASVRGGFICVCFLISFIALMTSETVHKSYLN